MLRRAHQISVSLFLAEAVGLGVTTTQFGAMIVLRAHHRIDQIGLAELLGVDRSTAALVVSKLLAAGYIASESDGKDKRRKMLTLTSAGHTMLDRLSAPAHRAMERALEPFSPEEADQFLDLLTRFVDQLNPSARAPIHPHSRRRRE